MIPNPTCSLFTAKLQTAVLGARGSGGLGWLLVAELGWWDKGSVGSVWDCRVEPEAVNFLEEQAIKQVGAVDVLFP